MKPKYNTVIIIVDSNANGSWNGGLYIRDTDISYGQLYCTGVDCEDSVLPAAGGASVIPYEDGILFGHTLLTFSDAGAGEWFIIDYNAISAGNCTVGLYDDFYSYEIPWREMFFTHVPSRDFNQDNIVNFADFTIFASYWGITDCTNPDECGKADFYDDDIIDINDLGLFVDFWLERTN